MSSPRVQFHKAQEEAKSHGIQALRYNKQYYSWELVCHSVKDMVPSPRPTFHEEGKSSSVCPFKDEKKGKRKVLKS
jgi:hypothetical protein